MRFCPLQSPRRLELSLNESFKTSFCALQLADAFRTLLFFSLALRRSAALRLAPLISSDLHSDLFQFKPSARLRLFKESNRISIHRRSLKTRKLLLALSFSARPAPHSIDSSCVEEALWRMDRSQLFIYRSFAFPLSLANSFQRQTFFISLLCC